MKLEVMSKHVSVRHFVDSNPSLHKNTPCSSFATGFSADSSSSSLWENERVRYNTCLVPGLTKSIAWWQFNVQRTSKDDHAKTLATGFTVQALWHPLSGWNLDINILKISAIAPAANDGTTPRGSSAKALILSQAINFSKSSSTTLWQKDEVWRTPPCFNKKNKLMAVPAANDGNIDHHWPLLGQGIPFFCFGFLVGEGKGDVWQVWHLSGLIKLVSWWQCGNSILGSKGRINEGPYKGHDNQTKRKIISTHMPAFNV